MSAEEIKSRINELSDDEKWRLELLCRDIDDTHSPAHYHGPVSSGTCRTWRLTGLATMKPYTVEQFCPFLLGKVTEEDSHEESAQEENPQQARITSAFFAGAARQQEDSDGGDDGSGNDGEAFQPDPDEEPETGPFLRILVGIVILAVLASLCGWGYKWITNLDNPLEPSAAVQPTVEVTRVEEVVVPAPTWTPFPTATEVVIVEVVETVEVTATYPVPTSTPTSTSTPTPTTTPIPPMELPFKDSFADDVDERWIGHNDNYIISGGALKIKDGDVRFTLKGPLPEKYNIDFGYVNGRYRIILGNQLSLTRNNGTRWEELRNGKYVQLEKLTTSETNIRIRLEVDGKVHRLFFDGIEQPEFIYNNEAGGDLVVELLPWKGATGITDFEISEP